MQPSLTEQQEADQDLDLWEMERDWKSSQKKRTGVEWLIIFPQAKSRWGKMMLSTLKFRLKELDWNRAWIIFKAKKDLMKKVDKGQDQRFYDDIIKDIARHDLAAIDKETRSIQDNILNLKRIGNFKLRKEDKVVITEDMVQRAKAYPLEKLIEFNRAKFTVCFGHADKKPSAYCKSNFVHCFVCQRSWDTIGVLMERDGMKFREAVLKLQ